MWLIDHSEEEGMVSGSVSPVSVISGLPTFDVIPAPVCLAPVSPAPVCLAPVSPAPVSPAPVCLAPVCLTPVSPALISGPVPSAVEKSPDRSTLPSQSTPLTQSSPAVEVCIFMYDAS